MVTAKFVCSHVTDYGACRAVVLHAVGHEGENSTWSKSTPTGKIEMTITNPDAYRQFLPGKKYMLTFSDADELQAAG